MQAVLLMMLLPHLSLPNVLVAWYHGAGMDPLVVENACYCQSDGLLVSYRHRSGENISMK